MKNALLALVPGVSYAAFVDGLAKVSFSQFSVLAVVGTMSFLILLKSLDSFQNSIS